jgi:hypothetical protein
VGRGSCPTELVGSPSQRIPAKNSACLRDSARNSSGQGRVDNVFFSTPTAEVKIGLKEFADKTLLSIRVRKSSSCHWDPRSSALKGVTRSKRRSENGITGTGKEEVKQDSKKQLRRN